MRIRFDEGVKVQMTGYRYGGFWRRGAAIFIDKIILYLLYFILIFLEFTVLPSSPYAHRPGIPSGIWADMTAGFIISHFILFIFISAVYFTYFHASTGQTPGKMLLRLKVVQIAGGEMTYVVAFLRWIGYFISALPFCLGFLWAAIDIKKQGYHDKIAGTVVILINNH
jgi:uncharacterized RDD family membrane protein YckC